jgi:hypothetical protein
MNDYFSGEAMDSSCRIAQISESFLLRLNAVIQQNNFFLCHGTPQALELFQLEKEDFLLWFMGEIGQASIENTNNAT